MKWQYGLIGVGVLLLWVGIGLWMPSHMPILGSEQAGVFGDQFGAVNALFSGLAFAGVIYAVILQSKELRLQREELEQTRKVLSEQKQQLENQNKTMQQQRFEATFFQMLSLHNEIVDQLEIENQWADLSNDHRVNVFKGRKCLLHLENILVDIMKGKESGEDDISRDTLQIHKCFYEDWQHLIGHYFRNLYTIIKMVDQSSINKKSTYTNIVRAQLSSSELALLFYNCLSPWGKKFKPLVEKYALLKTLPEGVLADESERALYAASAFGIQATE